MNLVYQKLSPQIGEIAWNEPISDGLLQQQLLVQKELLSELKTDIMETRIGFTRLSIIWKKQPTVAFMENWLRAVDLSKSKITRSDIVWQVPVCYDQVLAKDLIELASAKNISIDQLIELHSSITYRIHFFGFLPGFMYLNGLPEKLHTPRKVIPDRSIPAGSVAIGNFQTGIYPAESPGGWHVIGRSPISFFDGSAFPPVWAKPGESLEFLPISVRDYESLCRFPRKPSRK